MLPKLIQKYPLDITQKQKNYLENYKCCTLSTHSLCSMLCTLCSLWFSMLCTLSFFLYLSFSLPLSLSLIALLSLSSFSLYIFLSFFFLSWLVLFSCLLSFHARVCEEIAKTYSLSLPHPLKCLSVRSSLGRCFGEKKIFLRCSIRIRIFFI